MEPTQVFSYVSPEELTQARRIVESFAEAQAHGSASIRLNGEFVDYPIVEKAKRILERTQADSPNGGDRGMVSFSGRFDYSAIVDRPPIKWPGGARVALWVSPNVEHYEYLPLPNSFHDPWPRTPHPDVQQYAYRDYGNRVGFWRMLEVLDKHGIRCTVSLNEGILEHYPEIRDAMVARIWDFMSHGIYNTRYVWGLSEGEEREFIHDCIDTLKRHTGKHLKGMFGPFGSVTERTADLLAEEGIIYHVDWFHDDQPVPIRVKKGKLISMPYSMDINDSPFIRTAKEGDAFARAIQDQFDILYAEGGESGRVMCIALHPFIIGQPHRVRYLDRALSYIFSHDLVWQATADEIAEYYLAHYYDAFLTHPDRSGG